LPENRYPLQRATNLGHVAVMQKRTRSILTVFCIVTVGAAVAYFATKFVRLLRQLENQPIKSGEALLDAVGGVLAVERDASKLFASRVAANRIFYESNALNWPRIGQLDAQSIVYFPRTNAFAACLVITYGFHNGELGSVYVFESGYALPEFVTTNWYRIGRGTYCSHK
jgi:hypothetical protein